MPVWLSVILCALMGYLLGCINPSYLIARVRGFDIREHGSGNAGASNAVITMGKGVGVFSALFDIFKAWLAVFLAVRIFPKLAVGGVIIAGELAGVFCMMGHMFPIFMGFRGGKGLACLGGLILGNDWRVFLGLLVVALLLVLVTDYICVAPLAVTLVYPVLRGLMTGSLAAALVLCIAIPPVWGKHIINIKRILNGTEAHFSLLWNREKELERVGLKETAPTDAATPTEAPAEQDAETAEPVIKN